MPDFFSSATRLALSLTLVAVGASACATTPPTLTVDALTYEGGRLTVTRSGGDCEITLNGEINPTTVRQLSVALAEFDKNPCARKQLTLNASHGVVNSAITVGAMLKNRDFDTRIEDGSVCQTPCALVFMSGRERILSAATPAARIAFQPVPPDRDFGRDVCRTELTRAQSLTLSRYLRAMLPSVAATTVLEKIGSADCRRIEYLDAREALSLGLATRSRQR